MKTRAFYKIPHFSLANLILTTFVIVSFVYLYDWQQEHKFLDGTFTKRLEAKFYAVLSTSKNMHYMFPLPMTVLCWKKLGVQSIVLIIGSEETLKKDPVYGFMIRTLRQVGAMLVFIDSSSRVVPDFSLAQIGRLYASMLPFASDLDPKNSFFITTDADMLTFRLDEHIPKIKNNKSIKLYYSNCCGDIDVPKGGKTVHHYPMNTVAASIELWKEIMEVDTIYDGSHLAKVLIDEFGKEIFNGSQAKGSRLWSADESLLSYKVDKWINKNSNNRKMVDEYAQSPLRIDRPRWSSYDFSKINIADYDDSHLIYDTHQDQNWRKIRPLLEVVFKNDAKTMELLDNYQKNVSILSK